MSLATYVTAAPYLATVVIYEQLVDVLSLSVAGVTIDVSDRSPLLVITDALTLKYRDHTSPVSWPAQAGHPVTAGFSILHRGAPFLVCDYWVARFRGTPSRERAMGTPRGR